MLTIRPAERKDLDALTEIYNYEVLNTTVTFELEPYTPQGRLPWLCAHNTGNHPLLVAELDGRVCGYASLSTYRPYAAYREAVELSVYVARDARRRGIGKALMEAILSQARERNDIHTVISVITADNETSIRLHESFGFTHCGRMREMGVKFGRRLDIVNMQLMVNYADC